MCVCGGGGGGGGALTSVQFLKNSFFLIKVFTEISLRSRNMQSRVSEYLQFIYRT